MPQYKTFLELFSMWTKGFLGPGMRSTTGGFIPQEKNRRRGGKKEERNCSTFDMYFFRLLYCHLDSIKVKLSSISFFRCFLFKSNGKMTKISMAKRQKFPTYIVVFLENLAAASSHLDPNTKDSTKI